MAYSGFAAAWLGAATVHIHTAPVQHNVPGGHCRAGMLLHHQSCPRLPGDYEKQMWFESKSHGSQRVSYWYCCLLDCLCHFVWAFFLSSCFCSHFTIHSGWEITHLFMWKFITPSIFRFHQDFVTVSIFPFSSCWQAIRYVGETIILKSQTFAHCMLLGGYSSILSKRKSWVNFYPWYTPWKFRHVKNMGDFSPTVYAV